MTGCWLVSKNGIPIIEPTEENNFESHIEGINVCELLEKVMADCNHEDMIEIYCELQE
jgi:hypothetical protein